MLIFRKQLDIIQKYIGSRPAPKVISFGRVWKKTNFGQNRLCRNGRELLALSATVSRKYAFSEDNLWQREFEALFPYEETPDQLRSAREIKKDMEKSVPMDRLLCGDVGYGKTEVAARAVFKCAADGKQAAVLVPTTLLANQHYYTFKERLKISRSVEVLSRFRRCRAN